MYLLRVSHPDTSQKGPAARLCRGAMLAATLALIGLLGIDASASAQTLGSDCGQLLRPDVTALKTDKRLMLAYYTSGQDKTFTASQGFAEVAGVPYVQGAEGYHEAKQESNFTLNQSESLSLVLSKVGDQARADFLACT